MGKIPKHQDQASIPKGRAGADLLFLPWSLPRCPKPVETSTPKRRHSTLKETMKTMRFRQGGVSISQAQSSSCGLTAGTGVRDER
jgi:hypothetical protein